MKLAFGHIFDKNGTNLSVAIGEHCKPIIKVISSTKGP